MVYYTMVLCFLSNERPIFEKGMEIHMPDKKKTTKKSTSARTTRPVSSTRSSAKAPVKKSSAQTDAQLRRIARKAEKERTRRQVTAILLFAGGIFLAALTLIPGENVWAALRSFLFGIFGVVGYGVGPVMILIACLAASDKPFGALQHKLWQGGLLMVLLCGAIQILGPGKVPGTGFIDQLCTLYEEGSAILGGGLAAGLVGWPLLALFGQTGAAVTIILLLAVFLMLLLGLTLRDVAKTVSRPIKKIEESYVERAAERAVERQKKFNIDVDLGPDPQPQPEAPKPVKPSRRKSRIVPVEEIVPEEEVVAAEPVPAEEPPAPPAQPPRIEDIVRKAVKSAPPPSQEPQPEQPLRGQQEPLDTEQKPEEYILPPVILLRPSPEPVEENISAELKANAERLVDTLKSFGVSTKIIDISRGPAVTRYELQPAAGVKISRITSLSDDIALNLAATHVRIEAPIPGKSAIGIEVPNKVKSLVSIREMIDSSRFITSKSNLTVALGKDIAGNLTFADIEKMPHVLIAGATGSGKSICVNAMIISLLYKSTPDEVRFILIDPKMVEFTVYDGIPHLLVPVVTDPRKAAGALNWAVSEMEKRYKLFSEHNVRDIRGYNQLAESDGMAKLPQIVIIIDEFADLMMTAPDEVEDSVCRLAQKARAAGMHLVIATQRPSVNVITGVIKANIPSRIALTVSSQVDSRTILDSAGAEKLLGQGDMLYCGYGSSDAIRVQGCYVSDEEVREVVDFLKNESSAAYDEDVAKEIERQAAAEKNKKNASGPAEASDSDGSDEMLPRAIEAVIEAGQASTSLLQRKLKLGYARAARLVDEMEERGIVSPFEGSKPRQVLITRQQWLEMSMRGEDSADE